MSGLHLFVTGSSSHSGASITARRKAIGVLLAQRLRRAFPEMKDSSMYPQDQLVPILSRHIGRFVSYNKAAIDTQGIIDSLWAQFNLRVENPSAFSMALRGEIKRSLPGIIVPRLRPRELKPFTAEARENIFNGVRDSLRKSGRVSKASIESVLQWAGVNMPDAYFMTSSPGEIAYHLEQIAFQRENNWETFIISNPDGHLVSILEGFQKEGKSVKRARLHLSQERDLAVYVFDVGPQRKADLSDPRIQAKIKDFKRAVNGMVIVIRGRPHKVTAEELGTFVGSLSCDYLIDAPLNRMQHHFELYIQTKEHGREAIVEIDASPTSASTRITLVGTHIPRVGFLLRLVRILEQRGLELKRVFVETLENEATTQAIRDLSHCIRDREPIRALVEIAAALKEEEPEKVAAKKAIHSWGEARVINPLLENLHSSDLQKSKNALETLVSIGTQAQESTAINTFYVVKKDGKPLDDVRDTRLMQHLKEDFQLARWSFGEDFAALQTSANLGIGQTNLLAAAASFTQEALSYLRPENNPLTWREVSAVFLNHPDLVRIFVDRFESRFNPALAEMQYVPRQKIARSLEKTFYRCIEALPAGEKEVLSTAMVFLRSIRETNYFSPTSSLAFTLNPDFRQQIKGLKAVFPASPFGIFYVCGAGFRGFHVRFEDIARGGIRIVPHTETSPHARNTLQSFAEVYRLSWTQNYKNIKVEIPEGGSKGIIVLNPGADPVNAFHNYVDGLLDLIFGTKTLLFLGPDEGTGNLMDPGAEQAARRGYPFPRSFTTGKSDGGIPHDRYGITTAGVYEYERLIFEQLGLDEKDLTKVQTGGPDGDLGSNEIRVTQARTIAVVDRYGIAYDPGGLNRAELLRLAGAEGVGVSISHFDRKKLGPQGFLADNNDETLHAMPNGKVIAGKNLFGNTINNFEDHLVLNGIEADIFVPAGGKQRTINAQNVRRLFRTDGTPRFRIIVEGANVFITQEARITLEEKGVIIYKDSSANKGGVMSSSHEVLAAFMFTPEEFKSIYNLYVEQVKERIRASARREYALIEKMVAEKTKTGFRSEASDLIGEEMKRLFGRFMAAELPEDPAIDNLILSHLMPCTIEKFGREEMLGRIKRIPPSYRKAIAAARLASGIVYQKGLGHLGDDQPVTSQTVVEEARKLLNRTEEI